MRNQSEAYRNEVLPRARGEAAQKTETAKAYKQEVIARAEGDASRFGKLLTEYEKAPQVTRDRLYIETVQSVLSNTSKVMVDVKGGNNMIYLPLDKMVGSRNLSSSAIDQANQLADELARTGRNSISQPNDRSRGSSRSREIR